MTWKEVGTEKSRFQFHPTTEAILINFNDTSTFPLSPTVGSTELSLRVPLYQDIEKPSFVGLIIMTYFFTDSEISKIRVKVSLTLEGENELGCIEKNSLKPIVNSGQFAKTLQVSLFGKNVITADGEHGTNFTNCDFGTWKSKATDGSIVAAAIRWNIDGSNATSDATSLLISQLGLTAHYKIISLSNFNLGKTLSISSGDFSHGSRV